MENSLVKEKKITSRINKYAYTKRNRVEIVEGGKHFFDVFVKLIRESKKAIHIQTYAFEDDETLNGSFFE